MLFLLSAMALACDPNTWSVSSSSQTHVACVDWWLDRGYRAGWTAEDLELDPGYTSKDEPLFTAQQLLAMADAARSAAGAAGSRPSARAEEMLRAMASRRFQTLDVCCAIEDARPVFAKILAGTPMVAGDLALDGGMSRWSPATLWKLRNAVFARHGRPFSHVDLHIFFYGADAEGRLGVRLAPAAAFEEALLTPSDRANLTAIAAAEAR